MQCLTETVELRLSGHHNILEGIKTYNNGNTGLQVSGTSEETIDMWPSDNLILNCTSYNNCDEAMEDADGFAAKLTCGEGNVFRGCIAAYNADDGWDLFAKIATGKIGAVTIEDCVAFKNGYVYDESGSVIDAGNGNGFKMGGSGISGHHVLKTALPTKTKQRALIPTAVRILKSTIMFLSTMKALILPSIPPTGQIRPMWQRGIFPMAQGRPQ